MEWTLLAAIIRGDAKFEAGATAMGWDSGDELLDKELIACGDTEESLKSCYIQADSEGDTSESAPEEGEMLELLGDVTVMNTMGEPSGINRWYPTATLAFKDARGNVWAVGDGSF